jgi:N-methylhydantoinase B
VTGLHVPRGAALEISTGGGGGFGNPSQRNPAAVAENLLDGYVSLAFAQRHYPHVVVPSKTERVVET